MFRIAPLVLKFKNSSRNKEQLQQQGQSFMKQLAEVNDRLNEGHSSFSKARQRFNSRRIPKTERATMAKVDVNVGRGMEVTPRGKRFKILK